MNVQLLRMATVSLLLLSSCNKRPDPPPVASPAKALVPQRKQVAFQAENEEVALRGEAPPVKPRVAKPPLIVLSKEDNATLQDMVRRGVAYLKKTQTADGAWPGEPDNYVAFAGLALLEAGVRPDDPAIVKAAAYARSRMPHIFRTYAASLFLLFFDRLDDPKDNERIVELAMRLVCGQSAQGGWSYELPVLKRSETKALQAYLSDPRRNYCVNPRQRDAKDREALPRKVRELPLWDMPFNPSPEFFREGGDNSNTQFALLALWAARRHEVPASLRHGLAVDSSLWRVVWRFRETQNSDGSFCYSGKRFKSDLPSMTCAGLLAFALDHRLLFSDISHEFRLQDETQVQKALARVSRAIGKPAANPQAPIEMTEMYFLWSLEQVAVAYQLKKIGDKDWYQWGFTMLRKNQREDGSWHAGRGHGSNAFVDTCFALLFLQQADLSY